jgi:endoglycosylceramidase
VAQHAISLIEEYNFSNAYWSYDPGTENQAYFKDALLRPYPAYINGELINYN